MPVYAAGKHAGLGVLDRALGAFGMKLGQRLVGGHPRPMLIDAGDVRLPGP
jgi:hypothetical protein